jgi:hypothetical protein
MATANLNLRRTCIELRRVIGALHIDAGARASRPVARALALLHSALDELEGASFLVGADVAKRAEQSETD